MASQEIKGAYETVNLPAAIPGQIDWLGYERGAEAARQMNWRDELRATERQRRANQTADQDNQRIAQDYTSTFMHNLQVAAQAGIPTHQALVQFRDQILNDPYYQNMPIQAQQMVQSRLLQTVRLQADELSKQGRMKETMELLNAFGATSPFTQVDYAAAHGSPQQFVDAYRAQYPDSQMELQGDMIVAYPGATPIPVAQAMAQLAHFRSAGSLYGTEAGVPMDQMRQQLLAQYLQAKGVGTPNEASFMSQQPGPPVGSLRGSAYDSLVSPWVQSYTAGQPAAYGAATPGINPSTPVVKVSADGKTQTIGPMANPSMPPVVAPVVPAAQYGVQPTGHPYGVPTLSRWQAEADGVQPSSAGLRRWTDGMVDYAENRGKVK